MFRLSVSLLVRGYQRPLQAADLWPLREQDSSMRIMTDLEKFWTQNRKQLQYELSRWVFKVHFNRFSDVTVMSQWCHRPEADSVVINLEASSWRFQIEARMASGKLLLWNRCWNRKWKNNRTCVLSAAWRWSHCSCWAAFYCPLLSSIAITSWLVLQRRTWSFWSVLVPVGWFYWSDRKNSPVEGEEEGEELQPLPHTCSGAELWALLPVWYTVSPPPRCLHVRRATGAQVSQDAFGLMWCWHGNSNTCWSV